MLIEIHMIQNHSAANLNRDDLGAPKTCFFGGVLRSRVSSQCLKRSIRLSDEFKELCGGIRTRRLAQIIAENVPDNAAAQKRAEKILGLCGFKPKKTKNKGDQDEDGHGADTSKMLVYTTREAIQEMAKLLENDKLKDNDLAESFAELIATRTAVPDMALSGRMLEPDKAAVKIWENRETTVEAALQVAHAISTHEARPEIDYYVAADDVRGADAGAGYVDEAMFASACFYKFFSIDVDALVRNLKGYENDAGKLAAHTVGAFIRSAALVNPTGKQNSFAAHNPPDGILVEIKDKAIPLSYANAFAKPAEKGDRDIISQSVAQLGQYVRDLDVGYGEPSHRFWFSPNLRYPLQVIEGKKEIPLTRNNFKSLDEVVSAVVETMGYDWGEVQKTVVAGGEVS
jgi:CRISPR system Cascade subunit CasC